MRQLQEELDEGTVTEVRESDCQYVSPTFLVPKKRDEWRKILDCRKLNQYIRDESFQMEDQRTLLTVIEQGQYAVSIDIRKAYHHVPVGQLMQPYLAFTYAGRWFQYKGMPFGVKSAPRIFSQIMHKVMTVIRQRWNVMSVQYLDDLLFLHRDPHWLRQWIFEIAAFLERLGWTINWEKSQLIPTQQFTFLGIKWDSSRMMMTIAPERNAALKKEISRWMQWARHAKQVPVRQ
jgi:hypothetical protein